MKIVTTYVHPDDSACLTEQVHAMIVGPAAYAASPLRLLPINVFRCVRVALGAMGFLPLPISSSSKVLAICHGLQVPRVHAGPISTKMIHLMPWRDRPVGEFIRNSMSQPGARSHNSAISVSVKRRKPSPTGLLSTTPVGFAPKALLKGFRRNEAACNLVSHYRIVANGVGI